MFDTFNWQAPSRKILLQQAELVDKIHQFFKHKGVLSVSTPLLSAATTPDPAIDSVQAYLHKTPYAEREQLYLQTSPEFAMKRLLVNGSGDIYQVCQVFRDSDFSPVHNPEFTMLEWYRLGFDHHQLMDEVYALLLELAAQPLVRQNYSYQQLFNHYVGFDPFDLSVRAGRQWCDDHDVSYPASMQTVDEFLDLILSFVIQPQLPDQQLTFVYDYPVSQAALAKVRVAQPPVASRFEMYWGSIELANGFHELQDADEQRRRFESENQQRSTPVVIDEGFLQALQQGLPDCAGVALGVSRLFAKLGIC